MALTPGYDYIDGTQYLALANDLDDAVGALSTVSGFLWSAVYEVAMFQAVVPEKDLLTTFYDCYQLNSSLANNTSTYLSAVRALQLHVLTKATDYATIDDYIGAEVPGGKVPAGFATLSENAGYPISDPYII